MAWAYGRHVTARKVLRKGGHWFWTRGAKLATVRH